MGGHATHDEAEARAIFPARLFTDWGRRDPIGMYETWLAERRPPLDPSRTNRAVLEEIEAGVTREVEAGAEEALASQREQMPDPGSLTFDVLSSGTGSSEPAFPPCPVSATGAAAHR